MQVEKMSLQMSLKSSSVWNVSNVRW